MLHDFERYLKEKIKNEKTIRGYVKDVESFLHAMDQGELKIGQVKEVHIKKYNLDLADQHYSNHTIARKNSALRLFFKYLRKQGIVTGNPMEDIKQPSLPKRQPEITSEEEIQMKELMQSPRDRLLFQLLLHEGVKIPEVLTCTKGDYHEMQGILYLSKRAITISEDTKMLITEIPGDSDTLLVSGSKNKPLTESGIYYILKRYFKAVNRPDLRPIDLVKSKNKS